MLLGCETALSLANQKDEEGGKMATPTGLELASKASETFALIRLNDSTTTS